MANNPVQITDGILPNQKASVDQYGRLSVVLASGGGGGGGAEPPIVLPTVTPNFVSVGASASGTIPVGSKGWTFTILSGSGSLGGVPVLIGFSDSDTNTTGAAIAYTTGANSSAYIRYNT